MLQHHFYTDFSPKFCASLFTVFCSFYHSPFYFAYFFLKKNLFLLEARPVLAFINKLKTCRLFSLSSDSFFPSYYMNVGILVYTLSLLKLLNSVYNSSVKTCFCLY